VEVMWRQYTSYTFKIWYNTLTIHKILPQYIKYLKYASTPTSEWRWSFYSISKINIKMSVWSDLGMRFQISELFFVIILSLSKNLIVLDTK
jgi:hypothetical protein